MSDKVLELIVQWGPAALILAGLYRLAEKVGMKMVTASEKQAAALTAQAQSMEGLTKSLQDFVTRDSTEHREMLVLLRYLAKRDRVNIEGVQGE